MNHLPQLLAYQFDMASAAQGGFGHGVIVVGVVIIEDWVRGRVK